MGGDRPSGDRQVPRRGLAVTECGAPGGRKEVSKWAAAVLCALRSILGGPLHPQFSFHGAVFLLSP